MPSNAGGQRSDTIKIVHVDPAAGTASTLSIPRDTYVTLSGMPADSQLSSDNKINAAFAGGPDALIQTIQNTFGIPISHYIVINFFGLEDAVNALGGISMDFPYPVRDHDCNPAPASATTTPGSTSPPPAARCSTAPQALALSRSRYFQYYADGRVDVRPHLGHRPHPAPEPDHLGRPGQGQVHLQPAPPQRACSPRWSTTSARTTGSHPQRSLRPWPSATTPSPARSCRRSRCRPSAASTAAGSTSRSSSPMPPPR